MKNVVISKRAQTYDWNFEDPVCVMNNIYAMIYFFLADEYLKTFGEDGSECVKRALIDYGHFRGALLRARHQAMGLPINFDTLKKHYDLPGDARCSAHYLVKTADHYFQECTRCQLSDLWKILGDTPENEVSATGHFYCDYFKPALWEGYCRGLIVKVDKAIAGGDDCCTFFTYFEKDADLTSPSPAAQAYGALNWNFENPVAAMGNMYAFIYFFMAKAALDMFGADGEQAVRRGLRRYGHYRGGLLAWHQQQNGLELNVANFYNHYDLPGDDRTTRNRGILTETESRGRNTSCQFSDIWKLLEGVPKDGRTVVGSLYCQEFHPAMWEGYREDMRIDLSETLCYGDPCCNAHTTIVPKEETK